MKIKGVEFSPSISWYVIIVEHKNRQKRLVWLRQDLPVVPTSARASLNINAYQMPVCFISFTCLLVPRIHSVSTWLLAVKQVIYFDRDSVRLGLLRRRKKSRSHRLLGGKEATQLVTISHGPRVNKVYYEMNNI